MWLQFWVSGKGRETKYVYVDDSLRGDEEELKSLVEEWARNTSIGQIADHYRYGHTEVAALPDHVRDSLIRAQKARITAAEQTLTELEKVTVVPGCRRYACTEPATTEALFATEVESARKVTPMCDECVKANASWQKHLDGKR